MWSIAEYPITKSFDLLQAGHDIRPAKNLRPKIA